MCVSLLVIISVGSFELVVIIMIMIMIGKDYIIIHRLGWSLADVKAIES